MPKHAAHDTLARQWELLHLIPPFGRGPGKTAAELTQALSANGYPVDKRTVERDLLMLERLFPLDHSGETKPFGWHWLKGRSLDLPGVALADALSLALVEDLLRQLLPASLLLTLEPKLIQARKTLSHAENNRYAQWAQRVRYVPATLPFLPPTVVPRVLETVQEALLEQRQLCVRYCGANERKSSEQMLHPLALVQGGPITYLVATAFAYTEPRLYALHRMRTATKTEVAAQPPAGFALETFLAQGGMLFGEGGLIQLQAIVSNQLACYLQESPLADGQELCPETPERYRLRVTLKDSWQLYFWILSQGPEIVVEQPVDLRQRIAEAAQATAQAYLRP